MWKTSLALIFFPHQSQIIKTLKIPALLEALFSPQIRNKKLDLMLKRDISAIEYIKKAE